MDDGIFVYSVGARGIAHECDWAWWERYWPSLAGGAFLLATLGVLVWLLRQGWRRALLGLLLLIVSGGAGAFPWCEGLACYLMYPIFSHRTPEMVSQERESLEKHHARGVIGDQAYQKAKAALERDPTSQP